jgi:signal transduction histidine kinase
VLNSIRPDGSAETGVVIAATAPHRGLGGAVAGTGSGLIGLIDRVEALGGKISVTSHPGQGTALLADLPVESR